MPLNVMFIINFELHVLVEWYQDKQTSLNLAHRQNMVPNTAQNCISQC